MNQQEEIEHEKLEILNTVNARLGGGDHPKVVAFAQFDTTTRKVGISYSRVIDERIKQYEAIKDALFAEAISTFMGIGKRTQENDVRVQATLELLFDYGALVWGPSVATETRKRPLSCQIDLCIPYLIDIIHAEWLSEDAAIGMTVFSKGRIISDEHTLLQALSYEQITMENVKFVTELFIKTHGKERIKFIIEPMPPCTENRDILKYLISVSDGAFSAHSNFGKFVRSDEELGKLISLK